MENKRRMKPLLLLCCLLAALHSAAHPGVGIVHDSKGNIYYTDLRQVWKLTAAGTREVAVRNVHTHELYLDENDHLFGQDLIYSGEATNEWTHWVWRLSPDGQLDTIIAPTRGYFIDHYSFVRDRQGGMYWVEHKEEALILRTAPGGKTEVFARGRFNRVQWMLHHNNRVYFIREGQVLAAHRQQVQPVTRTKLSPALFGLWKDTAGYLYTGSWETRSVLRIDTAGNVQAIYTAEAGWSPTGGVFDRNNDLWVLEYSTANEARVRKIRPAQPPVRQRSWLLPIASLLLPLGVMAAIGFLLNHILRRSGRTRRSPA